MVVLIKQTPFLDVKIDFYAASNVHRTTRKKRPEDLSTLTLTIFQFFFVFFKIAEFFNQIMYEFAISYDTT